MADVRVTDDGVEIGHRPSLLTIDVAVDEELEWELWRPSHLVVDPDDIHLFDAASGASLRRQPSATGAAG